MAVPFEIVQVVPQPAPAEYAAIAAALMRLAAAQRSASASSGAGAQLRYQDVTRESILERPRSWSAAARLDALHV
ncbi:MAG: hypothetical protein M3Z37_09890 [Candidatus Eremiobacteraeota bacterium]|nr:hypothetical protein [Candidatus Eremiobacteraeota bacterium]